MMFLGRRQPHTIIRIFAALVAQDQNNLWTDINRQAPEHRSRFRIQMLQCLQHKNMRGTPLCFLSMVGYARHFPIRNLQLSTCLL